MPFGRREWRLWSPKEVEKGAKCGCVCPACGAPLIARNGPDVRPHFAHYRTEARPDCFETALHLAAKQWLLEHRQLWLPSLVGHLWVSSVRRRGIQVRHTLHESRLQDFADVQLEATLEDVRPDAIGVTADGQHVLIEIWVTHQVDSTKLDKLRRLGLPVVEVSLGDQEATAAMDWAQLLSQRLSAPSAHVRWAYHPDEDELWHTLEELAAPELEADYEAAMRELQAEQDRQRQLDHARRRAALEFQALPHARKLLHIAAQWRMPAELFPPFLDYPVPAQGAFGVPRRVWQAEAARMSLYQGSRGGAYGSWTVELMAACLAERFGIEDVDPRIRDGQVRAVAAWTEMLYDMRLVLPSKPLGSWQTNHGQVQADFDRARRGVFRKPPDPDEVGLVWDTANWPTSRDQIESLARGFAQDDEEIRLMSWVGQALELGRTDRQRPRDYAKYIAQYFIAVDELHIVRFLRWAGMVRPRRSTELLPP